MKIKADFHIHSAFSPDGRSSLGDMIDKAQKAGLDAIAICDHNECTEYGGECGIVLIKGVELSTEAGHILGLFLESPLDIEKLRGGVFTIKTDKAIEAIHEHGWIAVWAHPFAPQVLAGEKMDGVPVDAIESANGRAELKRRGSNEMARKLAERRGIVCLGDSDAHHVSEIGNCYTDIECDTLDADSIKAAVLAGKTRPVFVKNCTHKKKAMSQLVRAKRSRSIKSVAVALLYLARAVVFDVIKR